jgi:hypothetical protein
LDCGGKKKKLLNLFKSLYHRIQIFFTSTIKICH